MKTHRLLALAPALIAFACGPMRTTTLNSQAQTTVKVDNQAFLDMTIYVLRGAERVRLGLASGASTATFVIPADIARSATSLRFVADPVGSSRPSISEEVNVRPGDEVVMQIPPG
ncbi:MAG: hypothetical protein M3Z17_02340 [Gemmatimonadota bacterium]|nr:hypothetical protein [Gemmatimonadota bacterium]